MVALQSQPQGGIGGVMPGGVAAMPAKPAAPKPPIPAIAGAGGVMGGLLGTSVTQPHPMPTGGAGSMWFPENGPGLGQLGHTNTDFLLPGMGGSLAGGASQIGSLVPQVTPAMATAAAHQQGNPTMQTATAAGHPAPDGPIEKNPHPTPAVKPPQAAHGQPPAGPAGRPLAHPTIPGVGGSQINTGVTGAVSTFGAGGDLRNNQILPGQDPRLATTERDVNAARDNLATGPDRFALAQDRYKNFLTDSAPGDFDALRALRQSEAAGGRVGSGMEAKGFADLGSRIQSARSSAQNSFLNDALEGTIQDRRNNLSDLSGLEGQQFDQGQASRNEYRGERGYQAGQAQQSWDNNRTRTMDEEALTQGQWNRDEGRLHDITGLGYQGDPSSQMLDAAGQMQTGANQAGSSVADLLKQYAYGQSVDPSRIPQTSQGNVWGGAATRPYSFGYQL